MTCQRSARRAAELTTCHTAARRAVDHTTCCRAAKSGISLRAAETTGQCATIKLPEELPLELPVEPYFRQHAIEPSAEPAEPAEWQQSYESVNNEGTHSNNMVRKNKGNDIYNMVRVINKRARDINMMVRIYLDININIRNGK